MKNDRRVFYKGTIPQNAENGVSRRLLAYSDDLVCVENTFEKGWLSVLDELTELTPHADYL